MKIEIFFYLNLFKITISIFLYLIFMHINYYFYIVLYYDICNNCIYLGNQKTLINLSAHRFFVKNESFCLFYYFFPFRCFFLSSFLYESFSFFFFFPFSRQSFLYSSSLKDLLRNKSFILLLYLRLNYLNIIHNNPNNF